MRKPSAAIVLLVLLVVSWIGFLSDIPSVAQEGAGPAPKWRYRETTDLLKSLGEEGWEAYAVTDSDDSAIRYFLKKRM